MSGGFRQRMAWLHTWGGLWLGWLLYAIFLTGTLSVFDAAITRWMRAAPPATPVAAPDGARALRLAQAHLQRVAMPAHAWRIDLPDAADPALLLSWDDEQHRPHSARLDPATGRVLPAAQVRETEGGHHFVHMHYQLHGGRAGLWVVGFCTVALLVALVSGIAVHRRIFRDFFTFRPGKGQRSWLDAHNAVGVLTLPFQFMIAYTGLAVFYATYLPAGIAAHYPDRGAYFQALLQEPSHRDELHEAAPLLPLDGLLAQAEASLQRRVGFVVVEHPGDRSASVWMHGPFDEGRGQDRELLWLSGGRLLFDGVTGAVLDERPPRSRVGGAALLTLDAMSELHFADFGGATVKWLYFFCGLAGTALMATGTVLFLVKRRCKALGEFGACTAAVYRGIEVLNVGSIAGLAVACAGYLWANRLLPPGMEQRAGWEIAGFFAAWALAFAHAALRPARRAWTEQWAALAALCLLLPALNAWTTGESLLSYAKRGDGLRLGLELTALAIGLAAASLAGWLARREPGP
ncbi:MAG: PepSY-associated TM helix domain-containing protein [Roseateles sp.]|uniref:PepSY-associated TM helix domain-containing protein n=1 Tax=Roseateles sp. TaxID=1971397 RepID=UPI0039E78DB4